MVSSPIGRVLSRHAERAIQEALDDTRVVLVNGARQSGKSTLLRQFARGDSTEWRDLDLPLVRQAAVADPVGFVDYPGRMVIDEIQRVPELLLPIKVQVDGDPRPGRCERAVAAGGCGMGKRGEMARSRRPRAGRRAGCAGLAFPRAHRRLRGWAAVVTGAARRRAKGLR